jgi:hypothetical protein
MKASVKEDQPVVFRFYAGWEKSDQRFTTAEGFKQFLLSDMKRAAARYKN